MQAKLQLQYLISKDWDKLPSLLKEYRKNPAQLELEESIKELTRIDQEKLWDSIFELFSSRFIVRYFNKGSINSSSLADKVSLPEENGLNHEEENKEEDFELLLSILQLSSVHIDAMYIKKEQYAAPPEKLIQFIVLIGGLLGEFEAIIQKPAVCLCEKWISKDLNGKEQIYANTLLTLITIGLSPNAKKQDIKRVWMLQPDLSCLPLMTPKDAQSPVGKLLLSCASSSNYLNSAEGKKFLCQILLSPVLLKPFHETFRKRLPSITKADSVTYADIYVRAWRNSNGEIKKQLEEDCLQDLMYLAVHVDPLASKAFDNLLAFLHYVHQCKRHVETGTMIYRQYEPFIWRSLKVANGYVRMNAATIFCDAYPFHDSSLNQEEKELFMTQQYQAILTLLVDPCHLVRISVLKGLHSMLTDYWLMIPNHVIQKIFQILISKLIVDASSADVRVEVIKLIMQLLHCADAGPFIAEVLPRISESFDDINAAVRIAFIKLLIEVKSTSLIKYWKLVPLEHLLNRMANDVHNVRTLIAVLIQSSFLLSHFTEQEMFHRCISLVETNREAARRFYQYAGKGLEVEPTTKFILFIWRAIHRYVQSINSRNISDSSFASSDTSSPSLRNTDNVTNCSVPDASSLKQRRTIKARTKSNKENSAPNKGTTLEATAEKLLLKDDSTESAKMPLDDPQIIIGLLDTIVILWTVNSPRLGLQSNFKYLDALRGRISKTFPVIWSFFKGNEEIPKTLLYLSSFLPSNLMPTMVGLCISRLKSIEDSGHGYSLEASYTTYLNALANWNRIDDIMELISEWLETMLSSIVVSPPRSGSKRSIKRSRVNFQERIIPKPMLALNFLHHMLVHPLNRIVLLKKNRESVLNVCELLSNVKELIKKRMKLTSQISDICSDNFILTCWEDYLCIISILNWKPQNIEDMPDQSGSSTRVRSANKSASDKSKCNIKEFDGSAIHSENMEFINWLLSDIDKKNYNIVSFVYQCANKMLKTGSDFVAIGGANLAFIDKFLNFNKNLIDCYSSTQNASTAVNFICESSRSIGEVHEYLSVYSKDDFHKLPVTSCTERNFHHLITFISQTSPVTSELAIKDCQKIVEALTRTILILMRYSDILLDAISLHFANLTIKTVSSELRAHAGTIPVLNKVTDLGNETKILLLSMQKNTKMAEAYVDALKMVYTMDLPETCDILAATVLLALLIKDSGRVSRHSLKEVALAANEFLEKHKDLPIASEDSSVDESDAGNADFLRFCGIESKKLIGEIKVDLGLE